MKLPTKKILAVSLSAVLALATLNGCNKKLAVKAESRTLKIALALSEEEWAVMKKDIIPFFEKENNVKIETIKAGAEGVSEKLKAMKQSGKVEIDLITQDVNNIKPLVAEGLVEDLSVYEGKIPHETIGTLAEVGKFEDKTYFFPFKPDVEINYYDEDWFNWYDLDAPRTWEELFNVSRILKDKAGIGKIALNIKFSEDSTGIFEFIKQANGDPFILNDEGTIRTYTFLQKLWPYLSEDTLKAGFDETNEAITNQAVYYTPNSTEAINAIVKDGGKKQIKANSGFSGPNGPYKVLFGKVLGVPKGSSNKDLSVKFAQYLMSKEVQQVLVNRVSWTSFRSDAYAQVEAWQKPYFEAVQEALKAAQPMPNIPYWREVNKVVYESFREVVIDKKDVKATLDKYAAVVQKAKNDYEKTK